ncbi:spore coat protein [Oceanobacillus bengalensis]|uniref:Spore coat protein n=1 Tax=Oceanobacillus bengalensis TaxID=1435466 RepID=A0A494Z7S8_9BACI|nr:spore coat protein [Oceanobacillus bengalensis]RKQ18670.1 spore coat protein [Oceanobacillus bengalensis]
MRHHHGPNCGCPKCVVHPTKFNTVHNYSESVVEHVHPSHTNVINHHTVKNNHIFPHSTSFQNVTNSVDQMGPSFQVPAPPNQVAGAMSPGFGSNPGQVAGAMSPGFGPNGGQVAGAMNPGFGPGHMGHGCGPCGPKPPKKWC